MTLKKLAGACAALCLLLATLVASADPPPASEPVRIGMVKTLFTDIPQPLIDIIAVPFAKLMKDFTGMEGKMLVAGDPYEVAQKLADKKIDLAVFHGVEFGWVKQKHPELRPLMLCVNRHRHVKAFLVVRKECEAKSFADLKGRDLALPKRSKEHCRLFAEHGCAECGKDCPKLVSASGAFNALDDLCRGKLDGVVIDTISMEDYDALRPGCFARLKVIQESTRFPAACIAYRQGALPEATLKKFSEGMISANKDEKGREVMSLFKMSAFEPVPADYERSLADILKAYPPPATTPEKLSQR